MCGIIGGNNLDWNYPEAIQSIKHRGPDSQKTLSGENFSLAFARLSIIDLSSKADQPMTSNDGNVCLVFNGEIYGFRSIRSQLEAMGRTFKTTSDTEVLLNAYLEWGDRCIEHVDGMFAIAILDLRTMRLKLFRDRPGIKPLYYYAKGDEFAFCSELKGIQALCSDVTFEYDLTAVYDFLTYRYIPEPKTLYKNVYKLLPAHKLEFDVREKRITGVSPYWNLPVDHDPEPVSVHHAGRKLRHLINESVRDQLVADVPVGLFLSGGIDSSVLVAEASREAPQVETFSIGFDVADHCETQYAQEVASLFNTNHHAQILTDGQTGELFHRLKTWYDEPFFDSSVFPTYLVSKIARKNVTVVLTGDGGDEIFGGYRWYRIFKSINRFGFAKRHFLNTANNRLKSMLPYKSFPHKVLDQIDRYTLTDPLELYAKILRGMTTFEKKAYATKWQIPDDYDALWFFRKYYKPELPLLTRLQFMDFHTYLPGDILTKVDRVSMAVSLEARVPLLSRKIIEFSFSLPESIRYYRNKLKGLVKIAYDGILPEKILHRGKKGFSIPLAYADQMRIRQQEKILSTLFNLNA